jgi:Kef-type K+ transport system membrane component KefB
LALGAAGDRVHAPVEYFEELVFLVFFTVAGAHFDPRVFAGHWDLIAAYFLARLGGKMTGAALGARLSGAPRPVARWLGLGLAPQAGVAVGLALTLAHQPVFRDVSGVVVNVILATTVLYEVLGPALVRYALERAGELGARGGRPT